MVPWVRFPNKNSRHRQDGILRNMIAYIDIIWQSKGGCGTSLMWMREIRHRVHWLYWHSSHPHPSKHIAPHRTTPHIIFVVSQYLMTRQLAAVGTNVSTVSNRLTGSRPACCSLRLIHTYSQQLVTGSCRCFHCQQTTQTADRRPASGSLACQRKLQWIQQVWAVGATIDIFSRVQPHVIYMSI